MITTKTAENLISWVLTIGTLFSLFIVLIGGGWYLYVAGDQSVAITLAAPNQYTSLKEVIQSAFSLSPLGVIQFGVMLLVATQLLRVGLLVWFYTMIRDYKFTIISAFVLAMLVYSFIDPH